MPPGCSFNPRCPYAFDRCTRETPALRRCGSDRASRATFIPGAPKLLTAAHPAAAAMSADMRAVTASDRARGAARTSRAMPTTSSTPSQRDCSSANHLSMTAIAGESGSGKTTLARMMLGFIPPSPGGSSIGARTSARWRTPSAASSVARSSRLPGSLRVFNPFYRIDHVLTTPVRRYGLAKSGGRGRQLIEEALSRVGLRPQDTLGRFPHELSGGQRQRIMVARAVLLGQADHGRRAGARWSTPRCALPSSMSCGR